MAQQALTLSAPQNRFDPQAWLARHSTAVFTAAALLCGLLFALIPAAFYQWQADTADGWHGDLTGEETYLIIPGTHSRAKGVYEYEGAAYVFDDRGILIHGWGSQAGRVYYGNAQGHPLMGEQTVEDELYNFDAVTGEFRSGFYATEAGQIAYDAHGYALTGYGSYDGVWYYFDQGGILQTGLITADDGSGARYYALEDGALQSGWQELDEQSYYFSTLDHQMYTGAHHVGDALYYFDGTTGALQTGGFVQTRDGVYYADENGVCLTGWQELDDGRYYFGASGHRRTGYQTIEGQLYYFDEEGVLQTGFATRDGVLFYYGEDGVIKAGSYEYDGAKRLFDATGEILNGWEVLSGSTYYYDMGIKQVSEITVDGELYYLGADGILRTGLMGDYYYDDHGYYQTGWQIIDGVRYHFGDDGVMSRSTTIGNYTIDANGVATRKTLNTGNSVRSCFNWVRSYLRYVRIPAQNTKQEILQFALNNHYGACYHYAVLLNYALNRAGIKNTIVWGTNNNRGTTHCWNILANGMVVDACNNRYMITQEHMAALGYTPNWYMD